MDKQHTAVLSASTLIGDSIVNREGDDLGDLEELMIDLTSGRIAYAVLSFGGFLGLGEKLFAIPWDALAVDQEEERLILDVDEEMLEDAPGFDKNDWPATPGRDLVRQAYDHYGYEPYWRLGEAREMESQLSLVLSASTLTGDKVVNPEEEDLGELEALMIDLESGIIAYAVLSFGGFMGLGDKLFAIPWDAIVVDEAEERLILDIDEETLEDAPGFDKDDWPAAPNREYVAQIYVFYGYEPYWQ
jgi:sporulation protein YlmC with PRC-barrel domain